MVFSPTPWGDAPPALPPDVCQVETYCFGLSPFPLFNHDNCRQLDDHRFDLLSRSSSYFVDSLLLLLVSLGTRFLDSLKKFSVRRLALKVIAGSGSSAESLFFPSRGFILFVPPVPRSRPAEGRVFYPAGAVVFPRPLWFDFFPFYRPPSAHFSLRPALPLCRSSDFAFPLSSFPRVSLYLDSPDALPFASFVNLLSPRPPFLPC